MRAALLLAASLAFAGVTIAVVPTAAACTPPHCPGFGACHVTWEEIYLSDPIGPIESLRTPTGFECYY